MTLQPDQELAHYRILEKLGSGGMGEVWVAEDTRLRRKIALKVLPSWTAGDADRRTRFEREAQAVASLNHPNIVTIHSVEEAQGIPFLTMERIEGRKLGELIPKEGMPVERILDLAIPLADAISAVHALGITHRDLKPDNIMVTDAGVVKVLDFGLAKLREDVPGAGPETQLPTATLTQQGTIIGTAQYMSPEQAEGKPVGPASDVFSLGIILYEMATGARPFGGDTPISTISSILRDDPPPVSDVRRSLPRHLGRIVRRCLAKDPTRRYASARGVRNELEILQEDLGRGEVETASGPAAGAGVAPVWRIAALAGLAALALVVSWGALRGRGRAGSEGAGNTPHLHVSQQTFYAGKESDPSLSPDGAFLVYSGEPDGGGENDIFLERVGGRKPVNLTSSPETSDIMPAFSPDGARIAFRSSRSGGGIFLMGATGESLKRLTEAGFNPAWSADGARIAYATEPTDDPASRFRQSEIWIVDIASGESHKVYDGDAVQPSWSPSGRRIAYWSAYSGTGEAGQRDIWTIRDDGTDPVPVTRDTALDWSPVWARDGRIYFCSDRGGSMNLWRVRIDEESGATRGEPEPVALPAGWTGPLAVSADGRRLAYVAQEIRANISRVDFDPTAGKLRGALQPVTRGSLQVLNFRLSADGQWIAFSAGDVQEDLYLVEADGTGLRKLTDDPDRDRGPSFLPDGRRVIFYSNRTGGYEIWTVDVESGDLQQITDSTTKNRLWFPEVSPDGKTLAVFNAEGTVLLDLTGDLPIDEADGRHLPGLGDPPRPFLAPRWSPDGRFLLGAVEDGAVLYDVGAGEYRTLTAPSGKAVGAAWRPDGTLLAGDNEKFFLVDLTRDEWRPIVMTPDDLPGEAEFAPDGRTIFTRRRVAEADIWIADLQ